MAKQRTYRPKYSEMYDLSNTDLNLDQLAGNEELVERTYTTTTIGGDRVVWEVNELGCPAYSISTGTIKKVKVNKFVSVNQYRHYVLTEAGLEHIRELVLEDAL